MKFASLVLIGSISAIQLEREPLLSANASELEVHQRPAYSDHPVDYPVPDFGISHEIRYTNNNIKNAEKSLKHNLTANFGAKKAPVNPRNYVVPDFGADPEITYANDGLKWAQNSLGHKWNPTQDANGFWNVPEAAANDSYTYRAL